MGNLFLKKIKKGISISLKGLIKNIFLKPLKGVLKISKAPLIALICTIVFSCSSGGLDPRLKEALNSLSNYKFQTAKNLVEEVLQENPEDCRANLVYELVGIQALFFKIVEINDLITAVQGGIHSAEASQLVDTLLREILEPVEEYLKLIYTSSNLVWNKKCSVKVEDFPFELRVGSTIHLLIHLKGVMGAVESSVFSAVSGVALSVFDLIFSHNLNVNLSSVFQLSSLLVTDNFVNLLRSLGNFMELSSNFLEFHPDPSQASRIENIPPRLSDVFEKLSTIIDDLQTYNRKLEDFVYFNDVNGNKILDYGDKIRINFSGTLQIYDNPITITPYEFEIPYWVTTDLLSEGVSLLERMSAHLGEYAEEATSWFHIIELNGFLLAIGEDPVPDIIAIQPISIFKNPKPIRDLLPYWYYDQILGVYSFAVEGEIKEKFNGSFYVTPGDSPHFPDSFNFYNETITNFFILPDCITVRDTYPDYFILLYMGLQDPSFNGSIKVNLEDITKGDSCYNQDIQEEYQNFNYPDNYSLNKILAYLSTRFGSYIVPGLDFLFENSQDLSNLFDYNKNSIINLFFNFPFEH